MNKLFATIALIAFFVGCIHRPMKKRLVYRPKSQQTVEADSSLSAPTPQPADSLTQNQPQPQPETLASSTSENTPLPTKPNYYLIAASFQFEDNALKFQKDLLQKGFQSEVLFVDNSATASRYKVALARYDRKGDALAAAKHYNDTGEYPNTWVFTHKQPD